jgi:hypothetical protein
MTYIFNLICPKQKIGDDRNRVRRGFIFTETTKTAVNARRIKKCQQS